MVFAKFLIFIKVNPKMIMTLFAALVNIAKHGKQEEMIDFTKKTGTEF